MNKVFLGGTCAESTWREELIKLISVDYFNPVVKDWNEECQAIEETEKNDNCNIHLYVITKEIIGTYSIAEAIEPTFWHGKYTIFHVIPDGFTEQQLKSFKAVCKLIHKHGGIAIIDSNLTRTARIINYSHT